MDDIISSALPSNLFDGLWKGEASWRVANPCLCGWRRLVHINVPSFSFCSEVFRKPPTCNRLQGHPAALLSSNAGRLVSEPEQSCCFHGCFYLAVTPASILKKTVANVVKRLLSNFRRQELLLVALFWLKQLQPELSQEPGACFS